MNMAISSGSRRSGRVRQLVTVIASENCSSITRRSDVMSTRKYSANSTKGRCVVPSQSMVMIMGTIRFRVTPHRTIFMSVTGTGAGTGHGSGRLLQIEPLKE